MIPGDTLSPRETSGLRIGFAAVTTRGCSNANAVKIAEIIHYYLSKKLDKNEALQQVSSIVNSWLIIENI